jgi:hypothetical protein
VNPVKKAIAGAALVGATFAGGAIGATMIGTASAQTTTTAPAASSNTPGNPPANFDPTKGGHQANGITETLLTGDTAEKVKAAALAAVPGGTIQRVENDAEGSPYEAHMLKSDGTPVTVKVDSSFKVTGIETGGPGGPGGHGRGGQPPASTTTPAA